MGMTRQEQLDAVVRNYGEWEGNQDYPYAAFLGSGVAYFAVHGKLNLPSGIQRFSFTRAEVEQRKAELQNKPSWDDAPEGAKILVYSPILKQWLFGSYSDAKPNGRGWVGIGDGDWYMSGGVYGKVIGDWRDTLEKRPEQEVTPEEEEAFKMLEARNGECIGGSLTDEGSKWDGESWPPKIGCVINLKNGGKVEVATGADTNGGVVVDSYGRWDKVFYEDCVIDQSDREKWIEDCEELISGYATWSAAAEAMYDGFKSGKLKLPEVE